MADGLPSASTKFVRVKETLRLPVLAIAVKTPPVLLAVSMGAVA